MGTLILVRHGLSQWNLENRFTGWTDVPLSERGMQDAATASAVLKGMAFDVAWTSRLKRANDTLATILKGIGQEGLGIEKDTALNERHYGDLQGLDKGETILKHGEEQVKLWRRSYATRPPNGESMEDCERRVTPVFTQYILPLVEEGKTVLVVAHGNSIKPIMRYVEGLGQEEAASLEVSLTTPYVYRFEGAKMTSKETLTVKGIVLRVDQKTGEPVIQD
jgi:2,3-bisphosphoglycerate-dependent phosphoglycerate mutase